MGEKVLRTFVSDPKRDLQTLEYYRLNKILMRMIGQWPFSPIWQQRLGVIVFLCSVGTVYILEVVDMIKSKTNLDQIIDCIVPMTITTGSLVKLSTLLVGAKSVRKLFARMQDDWNTITEEGEKQILHQYAANSKFLTFVYMVYMYCTLFGYVVTPTIPMILNYLRPLNESRQKQFPSHAEYFIDDPTEHYVVLFFHQSLAAFSVTTAVISCDTMYATYVQHVCGIFASVNYNLEHLTDEKEHNEDLYDPKRNNRVFAKLIDSIEQHRKAIELAECVENTYYISNLIQMFVNMLIISITGVQTVINLDNMEVVLRYAPVVVAELIHLLYNNLPGQALHDHSTLIFHTASILSNQPDRYYPALSDLNNYLLGVTDKCLSRINHSYNCKWYSISKKSSDLLKLVMLRSLTPCQLTAGKFFLMDLERFSVVVKTSMSYFIILNSIH